MQSDARDEMNTSIITTNIGSKIKKKTWNHN